MTTEGGLSHRFLLAFILQALLISVTAFLGVWLARFVLEDVLVEQALEQEAAWFWDRRAGNPAAEPPRARNIRGYLLDPGGDAPELPESLRGRAPGMHELRSETGFRTLHVSERRGVRLLLVFDGEGVQLLTTYYGLVPLALVLVALYLTAWIGYRATHRVLSPITSLAREIRRMDVGALDPDVLRQERFVGDPDQEVSVLASALADFTERLDAFVERERNFTRDASHELRSPLTVISMAVEVLRGNPDLGTAGHRALDRIDRAARDMRELVEAFLLLARESGTELEREWLSVNELVETELDRARLTLPETRATFETDGVLYVRAPRQVLASLIGNLVRNALSHAAEDRVRIRLEAEELLIEDFGAGMAPEELARAFEPFYRGGSGAADGHGVGLTIVRRLSDRFGWPVAIDSTPGVGTRVRIRFPEGEFRRGS